jgi:Zn-dependent protease
MLNPILSRKSLVLFALFTISLIIHFYFADRLIRANHTASLLPMAISFAISAFFLALFVITTLRTGKKIFKSATLIHFRGIPVRVHPTFIFIILILTIGLANMQINILGFNIGYGGATDQILATILGLLTSVALGISIIAHELSHSMVLNRYNFKVRSITLFIFGGIADAELTPTQPKQEFFVAIAGPATSILLGSIFLVCSFFTPFVASLFLQTIAFYNFIMAAFNFLPMFPMDGGRILRSACVYFTDEYKGTKIACRLSQICCLGMAIFGILSLQIFFIFVAILIYMGATTEFRRNENKLITTEIPLHS